MRQNATGFRTILPPNFVPAWFIRFLQMSGDDDTSVRFDLILGLEGIFANIVRKMALQALVMS